MGADNLVWCRDGDLSLELRLPGERMMSPGADLARVDPARVSLFAADSGQRL